MLITFSNRKHFNTDAQTIWHGKSESINLWFEEIEVSNDMHLIAIKL